MCHYTLISFFPLPNSPFLCPLRPPRDLLSSSNQLCFPFTCILLLSISLFPKSLSSLLPISLHTHTILFFYLALFETSSYSVGLAGLKCFMQIQLALNPQRFIYPYLLDTGFKEDILAQPCPGDNFIYSFKVFIYSLFI